MTPKHPIWRGILTLAILGAVTLAVPPSPAAGADEPLQESAAPAVLYPVKTGLSAPVAAPEAKPAPDQGAQAERPLAPQAIDTPVPPILEGLNNGHNNTQYGAYSAPPDASGDIGPDHYIQTVNNLYNIWSPDGVALDWELKISDLYQGFGGLCETNDDGHPVVIYDHLADRWLISQYAVDNVPPREFHQCIAISTSPNPVDDPWFLYDYLVSTTRIHENAKIGVWTDGYYMTADQIDAATGQPRGQGIAVIEREKMLTGDVDARLAFLDLYTTDPENDYYYLDGMLPADLDGPPPPPDTPGYFLDLDDNGTGAPADQLEIWQLDTNWDLGLWPTSNITNLAVASFDSVLCGGDVECIPQPSPATAGDYLDPGTGRLMYRLQYRYQDGAAHMVVNHTVDAGSERAGIRWYHLQESGAVWSVADQGTYAPADGVHRWNGSAAMDASGNIAIGFSASDGTSVFPSIRYAGRRWDDPAGQMTQGEEVIVAGTGVQLGSDNAWGAYSSMSVDPDDQCTFWYTNQYIAVTNQFGAGVSPWRTKVGKFDLGTGECTTPTTFTVSGTITNTLTLQPIPGAQVESNYGHIAITDVNGVYSFSGLLAGSLTLTAQYPGFTTDADTVSIPVGGDVDFDLTPTNPFVKVHVGKNLKGNYIIPEDDTTIDGYPVLLNGPVKAESITTGFDVFTSQRTTSGDSYNELMGVPPGQFYTEYWFPWYDHGYPTVLNNKMRTWILVGNPHASLAANVDIYIGGVLKGSYVIPPGTNITPRWVGLVDGPVRVVSTNGVNIFASERVFTVPNNSFNETFGLPANQFTTEYWFPWYDSVNMNAYVLIGNTSASQSASVQVYIGPSSFGPYTILPNDTRIQAYTSTINGPVRVVSLNGIDIVASQAALSGPTGNFTAYNEVLGYPFDQFDTEYWFPWYDHGYPSVGGSNMRTWVLVGNPSSTTTAEVDIYIAGVHQGNYSIAPNSRVTPRWIGMVDGPVRVVSDIPVFASERVFTIPGNVFNEMMGYPGSQLTTEYWFPWYDSVNMTNDILISWP